MMCPKCKGEIISYGVKTIDIQDDEIYVIITGHCSDCDTRYRWEEKYYNGGINYLEEVKEDE